VPLLWFMKKGTEEGQAGGKGPQPVIFLLDWRQEKGERRGFSKPRIPTLIYSTITLQFRFNVRRKVAENTRGRNHNEGIHRSLVSIQGKEKKQGKNRAGL